MLYNLYNSILIITSIICLILYILTEKITFCGLTWAFLLSSQILASYKMLELFIENKKLKEELRCDSTTSTQP